MATKKKAKTKKTPQVAPSSSRSVDMKKANNGFLVSTWSDGKEILYIATTKKEAVEYANKLLAKI